MDRDGIKGFIGYLNLYITIPVSITVIILLAILATACYYVKTKKEDESSKANGILIVKGNDLNPP